MMHRTQYFPIVLACAALGCAFILPAFADDPPPVYYVSMRGLTTESAPSFVTVTREADATRATSLAGCDELTYYATAADAQTIATARAAGEVVQLHRGAQGGSPQSSAIVCIIDGAGGT